MIPFVLVQAAEGMVLRDLAGGPPATLLPGTHPCCTRQPRDMLHCLGGMAVLLPFLTLLDPPGNPQDSKIPRDASQGTLSGAGEAPAAGEEAAPVAATAAIGESAAAEAVRLVAAMLEGCPANVHDLRQINGGLADW